MIRSLGDELLGYKMQVSTDTEVHLELIRILFRVRR